jgi:hypothetical protein
MPKKSADQDKQPAARMNVSLSVDDAYLDQFSAVVQRATAAGLHVGTALESIGVLTGTIDEAKVAGLRQVKGIAHVEGERH